MASLPNVYKDFIKAVLTGNLREARRMIAPNFRIRLVADDLELNLDGFRRELERQLVAFPDLGNNIKVEDVKVDGLRVVLTLRMTMHFTGPLTSPNHSTTLEPTGATIVVISQDHVTFTADGRIQRVEIYTDWEAVTRQLFKR